MKATPRSSAQPARLPTAKEYGRDAPGHSNLFCQFLSADQDQRTKSQIRMMIGIGIPSSHNAIERMDVAPLIATIVDGETTSQEP